MSASTKKTLHYKYLNRISYADALQIQQESHRAIKSDSANSPGYLYLLEHHPVITNGRFGNDDNYVLPVDAIEAKGVEVYSSDRGGDLTFHGPGQLVTYPILNLRELNLGVKAYIFSLEQVIIDLLADYAIESDRRNGYPGVWTNGQKIASIGVSIKNGITMHGSALNVSTDLNSFSLIVPCGISDVVVTSMQKVLGRDVEMDNVIRTYQNCFMNIFDLELSLENGLD